MRLIKFELIKILSQKSVWITLLAILSFFTFSYITKYQQDDISGMSAKEWQQYGKKVYKEYQGIITPKQEKEALTNSEVIQGDNENGIENKLSNKDRWRLQIETEKFRIGSLDRTKEKIKSLENEKEKLTGIERKEIEKQLELLKKRKGNKFYYSFGWTNMIDYSSTLGLIAIAVLTILGLSSVFSNEQATGMDQNILSSKKGKKTIVTAKLVASLIYVCMVSVIIIMFDVIANLNIYGLSGGETSFQMSYKYTESPYEITLKQFYFIKLGYFILGAVAFSIFVLLSSLKLKNSLATFFVASVVFGIPEILKGMGLYKIKLIEKLGIFSFYEVMRAEKLYDDFKSFEVFGNIWKAPEFAFTVTVIILVSMTLYLYRSHRKLEIH